MITIWNHQAFFDYVDRWVIEPENWGNNSSSFGRDVTGYGGDGNGFMEYMWNTYR